MKKGLLSILVASAVLVGCQNYDDQFDALNTQITSLKTQVEGLAGVQSDVAALKGLISSLQGAIDGVDSSLSSQLASALEDIQAVEDLVSDVATADDLSTVQSELAEVDANVDALLESDSFFNGNLTINSDATLTFVEQLGDKVKVINGTLTITGWEGMDAAAVNVITAKMITITGDVKVRMPSQTYDAITFPELSSVADIKIAQAGSYTFPKLVSAGQIDLGNNYSSKLTIIDFRALSTVTTINTGSLSTGYVVSSSASNTIDFDEAEEIHLTAIGYYTPKTLTIVAEEGGVVDLSAFTSQDSEGVVRSVTLNITGATSVDLPNYKNGSFTATDVETVILNNFYGSVTISGVENLTVGQLDSAMTINDTATLTEITVTGVKNPDDSTDKSGPALNLSNQTNLETATVNGLFTTVNFTGCSNLTDLTMGATANSLTLVNNGDLSEVDLAGASINAITVDNADDLNELELAHTTALGKPNGQSTALTAGSLTITGNAKLSSLSVTKANSINSLTITGNVKLETLSFDALKVIGGTSANVTIGGTTNATKNKLNASKITDKLDGTSSNDLGSIETTSGLDTLKAYLTAAAAAPGTSGVKVYLDSADLHVVEVDGGSDTEQNNLEITTAADVSELTVTNVTASTSSGKEVRQTVTVAFPVARTVLDADKALDAADDITVTKLSGVTKTYNAGSGSGELATVTDMVAALDGDTDVPGITISADRDAFHEAVYTIAYTKSDGTANTLSSTAAGNIYFEYGTDPETGAAIKAVAAVTAGASQGSSTIASSIATALNAATHAYVSTATTDGKLLVTPLVSGTLTADRGPLAHGFNNLSISTTNASTTLLLAGDDTAYVTLATAASNTTAIASSLFNLSQSKLTFSGMRVTLKNTSTSVNLGSLGVAAAGSSVTFNGYDITATDSQGAMARVAFTGATTPRAATLVKGTDIVTAAVTSNALDYVAAFSDIENVTTTAGSTVKKHTWL